MDSRRIFTLAGRIFTQILRDRRTLALVFIVPLVVLALAGVLLKSEPAHIALGIVDQDQGIEAQTSVGQISVAVLVARELQSSDTFDVVELAREDVTNALEAGRVKGVLIFPSDFSLALVEGRQAAVELKLEGSNPSTAGNIHNQVNRLMMQKLVSLKDLGGQGPGGMPVRIEPDFVYGGPDFDALDYIAPVFIVFFVFFFVFLLTCVFFLRERSQGTMERLLATPINRLEIVLGYMLGLGGFALVQSAVVLLFTVFALNVHYSGNLLVVFVIEVVLTMVAANMGILASTFASNEFQVVQFIPLVITPQALLSGTIWPIEQMPAWLQPLAWVVPVTYANRAMRDVMIKGVGWDGIWMDLSILCGFAALMIVLGALTVRREVA